MLPKKDFVRLSASSQPRCFMTDGKCRQMNCTCTWEGNSAHYVLHLRGCDLDFPVQLKESSLRATVAFILQHQTWVTNTPAELQTIEIIVQSVEAVQIVAIADALKNAVDYLKIV